MDMKTIKPNSTKSDAGLQSKRIAGGILVFILTGLGAGLLWWNWYKKELIKTKVEQTVHEKSQGLYKVTYDDLILDEIEGSLSIHNFSLRYDSARIKGLALLDQPPSFLINIHIPEIHVRGVLTPKALIEMELVGRILEVKNPVIEIFETGLGKDSSASPPSQEVYKQILGNLELISIDSILATGAYINVSSLNERKPAIKLENISVSMIDVKVDSASNADTGRFLFSRQLNMEGVRLAWPSANKLYEFNLDSFTLNSKSRTADIKEFHIRTTLSEEAYVNQFPTQKDRFNLVTKNIHLVNLDVKSFFENKLFADSMIISALQFRLYRDLTMKRDRKNRLDKNLQSLLNELPVTTHLGKIIIQNGYLEYKLIGEKTQQPGTLQFSNLFTTIGNFTNDAVMIEKNKVLTVDMNARFLNQSKVNLNWKFYLGRPDGAFDLRGTLNAIDAFQLNPVSRPLAALEFVKGRVNGLQFDLSGNIYGVEGQVQLSYQDLKVKMLKLDEDTQELKKDPLTHLAANIIIRNSSAEKNGEVKVEQVNYKRDPARSFLSMTWKAVLSGIKQSLGVQ